MDRHLYDIGFHGVGRIGLAMKFPLTRFQKFCSSLVIDSKEEGLIPLKFMGSQLFVMKEIADGLEKDIHNFTILKGRQLGISTVTLALDVFWGMVNKGIQGAVVVDSDDNREYFRSIIQGYHKHLPPSLKIPMIAFNRNQAQFANRSRIMFLVAGTKRSGKLGRAKGINFLHATECGFWVDEEGLQSLRSSLAQNADSRLYIWESTANGFNIFYEMWEDAKKAMSQKAIFVGWWLKESNSLIEGTDLYEAYKGRPDSDELAMMRQVKMQYGWEISMRQLSWYRWMGAEVLSSPEMLKQEFPCTEQEAFVATGRSFFSSAALTDLWLPAKAAACNYYRYVYGLDFEQTSIDECDDVMAELTVWEEPKANGFYVLGADPAYGSDGDADRFALVVLRCYSDRVEQVAEYCTTRGSTATFAWVIAHLAGTYRATQILEINGPGMGVWTELQRMMQGISSPQSTKRTALMDAMGSITQYLYSRPDSPRGSIGVYHWKTTRDTKEYAMNNVRDMLDRKRMTLRSVPLLEEMRYITYENGWIGSGKSDVHDDRVIALMLAVECYLKMILPNLAAQGVHYQPDSVGSSPEDEQAIDRAMKRFLGEIG